VSPQSPLPLGEAWVAVARCIARSAELLARGRIHLPRSRVGDQLSFADGTSARVYRETVVDRPPAAEPTVLVVAFRLRGVRGVGHDLFRLESMLNTPLFVGFDGFVSKLWLAHDSRGPYRGLYEWDNARLAEAYARRCGACWPWSASEGRSATTSSRACTATSCCRTRRRSALKAETTGG
jgi:hypothetical protein